MDRRYNGKYLSGWNRINIDKLFCNMYIIWNVNYLQENSFWIFKYKKKIIKKWVK